MTRKILLIGFGYTAQHLSTLLIENNIIVEGTTRDKRKIIQWKNSPIKLMLHDHNTIINQIGNYDYLLISAPPDTDRKDPIFSTVKSAIIKNANRLQWLGYLSSTSVYGNHKGKWINEESSSIQPGNRGINRLNAESNWMSLYEGFNLPIHIFRLAGIYGPKRNILVRIVNGKTTSITKEGQVFSRIHVKDICRALFTSIKNPTPGEIYNLADNLPCSPQTVDDYAAQLLGKPLLKRIDFKDANLAPMVREFYQDSRKVSNEKFIKQFNFELTYPSYKEGLQSLYKKLNINRKID